METTTTAIDLVNTPVCDKCGCVACRHDDDDDEMYARCRVYTTQGICLLFKCPNEKSAKSPLARTTPSYSCYPWPSGYDTLRHATIRSAEKRLRRYAPRNNQACRGHVHSRPSAICGRTRRPLALIKCQKPRKTQAVVMRARAFVLDTHTNPPPL